MVHEVADGLRRVRLGSGGGVPGRLVDAWLVGRRRVVVVDPGDPTDAGLDAVLGAAADAGTEVAGVVATSASPDRVGAAVGLALVAGVPLVASAVAAPAIGDPCGIIGDGEWIRLGDVPLRARVVEDDPDGAIVLEVPELGVLGARRRRGRLGRSLAGGLRPSGFGSCRRRSWRPRRRCP